jgi:hypothetical protein
MNGRGETNDCAGRRFRSALFLVEAEMTGLNVTSAGWLLGGGFR